MIKNIPISTYLLVSIFESTGTSLLIRGRFWIYHEFVTHSFPEKILLENCTEIYLMVCLLCSGSAGIFPGTPGRCTFISGNSYKKIVQKKRFRKWQEWCPWCPGDNPVLDNVDKRYSDSRKSYEKMIQEKDPGTRKSFVQRVQNLRLGPSPFPRYINTPKTPSLST